MLNADDCLLTILIRLIAIIENQIVMISLRNLVLAQHRWAWN